MASFDKKGMILFIVLGVILVVGVLAIAVLRLISSQARLTHHQVTRIQAQYAAKAGVIYALDKLRRNDDVSWSATTPTVPVVKKMCRAVAAVDPLVPECNCSSPDVTEAALPFSIKCVNITIYDPAAAPPNQGVLGTRKVSANAVFTYSPE
jgi:Tfp pilus assembly protein PilX